MATSSTVPALFRFQITNNNNDNNNNNNTSSTPDTLTSTAPPTYIEHTHPVPLFLTQPSPSQINSPAFTTAYIDVLSIITHQHHTECLSLLPPTTRCPTCANPSTDLLKSPMSYLHLVDPMVIISLTPFCGARACEHKIRAYLTTIQTREMERKKAEVWSGEHFGKMACRVCGGAEAKRCAGCGTVAYCGKECQRMGWKAHKRVCERRNLEVGEEGGELRRPYDTI